MRSIKTYGQFLRESVLFDPTTRQYWWTDFEGNPVLDLGKSPSFVVRDLEQEDLSNLEFPGEDFSRSILKGANLRGCDFSKARLDGSDMTDANISNASFEGASMVGVVGLETCEGINLATFQGADLTGVDLGFFARIFDGLKGNEIAEFFDGCTGIPSVYGEKIERMKRGKSAFGM